MIRTAALLAMLAPAATAYVEALYPLQQVLGESEVIAEGLIEKVDATSRIASCRITKTFKGKCGFEVVRMNLSTGQEWHPDVIMKHFVPGQPMLIFYNAERRAEAYVNRFFFQLYGDVGTPPEKAWWTFTHIEVKMNRTFNGTVPELSDLVQKVLSGRAKVPAPNPKPPPISRDSVRALPAPGEAVDETALPAPFLKAGLTRRLDPRSAHLAYPTSEQGFLRHWLVLGPIPLGPRGSEPSEAVQKAFLDKEWFPKAAEARPRELEKTAVGGADLEWSPAEAGDATLEFGAAENALHIAVCYVVAETDLAGVTMLVAADDGGRVLLDGKEIHRGYPGRGTLPAPDRIEGLTLHKGVNVLQAWVVNGRGPTGLSVRFLDAAGTALKSLRVSRSSTPELK
jgi:hypothetical protein